MGVGDRKNLLITALRAKRLAYRIPDEHVARFELMYRQSRTEAEQDQVTGVLESFLNGWKTAPDVFSRLLRNASDFGEDTPIGEDEDEDPPALREALARSRVTFQR